MKSSSIEKQNAAFYLCGDNGAFVDSVQKRAGIWRPVLKSSGKGKVCGRCREQEGKGALR